MLTKLSEKYETMKYFTKTALGDTLADGPKALDTPEVYADGP